MNELVVSGVWQAATLVALGVKLVGVTERDHKGFVNFRVDNTDGGAERLMEDWDRLPVQAGTLARAYQHVVYVMRTAKAR